jgi:hypothetical protein
VALRRGLSVSGHFIPEVFFLSLRIANNISAISFMDEKFRKGQAQGTQRYALRLGLLSLDVSSLKYFLYLDIFYGTKSSGNVKFRDATSWYRPLNQDITFRIFRSIFCF